VKTHVARLHHLRNIHVVQYKNLWRVRNSCGNIHANFISTVILHTVITTVRRSYTVICIVLKYILTYFLFLYVLVKLKFYFEPFWTIHVVLKFKHAVPDLSKIQVIPVFNIVTSFHNRYWPGPCKREQIGSKTPIFLISTST